MPENMPARDEGKPNITVNFAEGSRYWHVLSAGEIVALCPSSECAKLMHDALYALHRERIADSANHDDVGLARIISTGSFPPIYDVVMPNGGIIDGLNGTKIQAQKICDAFNAAVSHLISEAEKKAFEAGQKSCIGQQYPNNRVACVSCKKSVEVTALNAVRCWDCPRPCCQGAAAKALEMAADVAATWGLCEAAFKNHLDCGTGTDIAAHLRAKAALIRGKGEEGKI